MLIYIISASTLRIIGAGTVYTAINTYNSEGAKRLISSLITQEAIPYKA